MVVMPEATHYQQYELLRREDGSLWELGRGAMGVTYKAFDPNLCCTVALKVINAAHLENNTAQQRFLREARAAAALRHPNVAAVFRLGVDQGHWFYVMEFIDGETLEAYVARHGPLEPVEALRLVLQVARALGAAAKQRLVHRDLKPANLMLVDQAGELVVKVIDFGLAKVTPADGDESSRLTMRGDFVGTPYFTSPEQVEESEVDGRSDIYSLGATLYFMLTGRPPFSGSAGQVMSQHLYKPVPLEPLAPLPGCVAALVQQMMAKDRTQRPQTPRELQAALLGCLEELCGRSAALALSAAPKEPLGPGTVLAQRYRLVEEVDDSPQGRHFLAQDLREEERPVSLLALSREFLSDPHRLTALEQTVERLREAPHPTLRGVFELETVAEGSLVVEEYVEGPSLLEVLRRRGALSAPEVVRLLSLLAPLADHASAHGLEHVDFTLAGVHLVDRRATESEFLGRPLTSGERLELKVDAIDFAFSPANAETWTGTATLIPGTADGGPRSSYVRLLSLLAYELLGGPRTRVESTGRYTPVVTLSEEGNAALRRGLVDEFSSADELTRQLTTSIGIQEPAGPERDPTGAAPEPQPQLIVPNASQKRFFRVSATSLALALSLVAVVLIGGYTAYQAVRAHRSLSPTTRVWAEPTAPRPQESASPSPTEPATPTSNAVSSPALNPSPPQVATAKHDDQAAVVQAPPSPIQASPAAPAESAGPAPNVVLPVATSTPPPPAPSPTLSPADELADAKRYLQANDYARALPLLQQAAGAGTVEAMTSLALLYANGQGVTQDYAKARDWYQKAAGAGDPVAMDHLGLMYELGQGGAQDPAKAREWRQRAAEAAEVSPAPTSPPDASRPTARHRGSHKPRPTPQQTPKPSLWQKLFGKKDTKDTRKATHGNSRD